MLRRIRRFAVLAALALPLGLPAQQRAAFSVGTASAAPGQKATGLIQVAAGVDAATDIPVVVVHGAKPGPVLALVSGAHGTEYTSIIAVEKLIAELDPAQLSGTVILIPLVNVPSFLQKVPHVNPVDGKSMNRFYPGNPAGTQTERALFLITREVVDRCDFLVDFHGGDLDESLRPYSYWVLSGNARQDEISRRMVLAFGLDHIIISSNRPKDPAASRYLDNTAALRGKPAIAVEAGHAGTTDTDDIALLVRGSLSLMRHLQLLPGAPSPVEHPVWIQSVSDVQSPVAGIFYPLVKRGSLAAEGMLLGAVTDFFGKTIFEARAPVSGVVLYICSVPSMNKGNTIATVGVPAAKAP